MIKSSPGGEDSGDVVINAVDIRAGFDGGVVKHGCSTCSLLLSFGCASAGSSINLGSSDWT